MAIIDDVHDAHGATFVERGGRRVVRDYGRPARTAKAVRRVVGAFEAAYGVVTVAGSDRHDFVDDAVTNVVPREDGEGTYALLLSPEGRVRTDMYVYEADGQLLCFTPPGQAGWLAEEWDSRTFVQDVDVSRASDAFAVFGVHGPKATEKVASVLNQSGTPDAPLSFVRGTMGDAGVTVVRTDDLAGEEGFEVVCGADDADLVWDVLLNHGNNAAPFGYATWETLTLEAGSPLFATELDGRVPNVSGVRNAVDYEKGCFVGQETVARVENVGRPSRRLVGVALPGVEEGDALPAAGADVVVDGEVVGELTRTAWSPHREVGIAFALVPYAFDAESVHVAVDEGAVDEGAGVEGERVEGDSAEAVGEGDVVSLPFVDGGQRSARIPTYE
ncbi:aminomethyl transferase family protein [Halorubellus sp. JP-L1]|uniref:CAF17-like 4Fe-4S cluster assembly/insertion protein YgfZ n=1 Tax=Halorubellus sp. JP-L1 TaxID=2715753 RepID=UPI00140E5D11|nr:aminomethyl transferase family protein [Halorubellus sp. JP-L1]NHN42114.1 aminomethyl transferase family protein [Halorubellus sp. JP-L1]